MKKVKAVPRVPRPVVEIVPVSSIPQRAFTDMTVFSNGKAGNGKNGHRKRVLVVDDDENVANAAAAVLGNNGYECFATYNAADAIAAAESFTPDVVLSDVVLSGMDGVEACAVIQKALPACRFVLYSGQVSVAHSLVETAARNGQLFDLIAKPVHPAELISKVERLFA